MLGLQDFRVVGPIASPAQKVVVWLLSRLCLPRTGGQLVPRDRHNISRRHSSRTPRQPKTGHGTSACAALAVEAAFRLAARRRTAVACHDQLTLCCRTPAGKFPPLGTQPAQY